jgi:hypothetical protein
VAVECQDCDDLEERQLDTFGVLVKEYMVEVVQPMRLVLRVLG